MREVNSDKNPDIYGWITVPGTNIDEEIVQDSGNGFYLTHDSSGEKNSFGAIFSEQPYNNTGFVDRVTVLYGHDIWTDDLKFHQLHLLEDRDFFETHLTLTTFTDEQQFDWQILAAYTTDDNHLLANNNCFRDVDVWQS